MLIRQSMLLDTWSIAPLGDVVEFLDNKRKPITAIDRVPGPYPYYGANGQQDSVAEYIFDEPLLLLAEDGGHFGVTGKKIAYRVYGKCWVNNHAHVLRPKSDVADLGFLCRTLERYDVTPFVTGTTRGKLTKAAAARIPVPLPSIGEQRRIAAILDKADAIRRKRREAIALTEELLRSTFLEMFGDPVTNPKGWPTTLFGLVGKLDRGMSKHRPRNDPALLGGPYPLIQTGEVSRSEGVIRAYSQTYSEFGLSQSRMWPAGTLCITIAASIAQTGVLAFDACFPDSVVGFHPKPTITTEYVQGWLSFLQPLVEARAPQVAQKNINLEILRALEIPTPPLSLLQRHARVVSAIRANSEHQRAAADEADNLFHSLVQRAFRGDL